VPQGYKQIRTLVPSDQLHDKGVAVPAKAYELNCVAPAGGIVKEEPILLTLIWERIAATAALVTMAVLAFAVVAPAAVLANKPVNDRAKSPR
jgi:hypothetical protein